MTMILVLFVTVFPSNEGVTLWIDLVCYFGNCSYLFTEIRIFKGFKNKIFEIYLFTAYTLLYFHISHYSVNRIFKGNILLREKRNSRNWSTFCIPQFTVWHAFPPIKLVLICIGKESKPSDKFLAGNSTLKLGNLKRV